MSQKPILFNTEMVKAILDGRKTQTRRIAKGLYDSAEETAGDFHFGNNVKQIFYKNKKSVLKDAPYKVGDILYVRETWCKGAVAVGENPDGTDSEPFVSQCLGEESILYKEQMIRNHIFVEDVTWKPSIHMPKEAARIFLKVTDVRVERLRDITEEDAKKEGTKLLSHDGKTIYTKDYRTAFKVTWDKIYNNWKDNPWVWVIEFEKIDKRTI